MRVGQFADVRVQRGESVRAPPCSSLSAGSARRTGVEAARLRLPIAGLLEHEEALDDARRQAHRRHEERPRRRGHHAAAVGGEPLRMETGRET